MKFLQGAKLKDLLEYPVSMQEKIYEDLKDNEYINATSES